MAQALRVLVALAEVQSLVLSTHVKQSTITCNFSSRRSDSIFRPWQVSELTHSDTHTYTQ